MPQPKSGADLRQRVRFERRREAAPNAHGVAQFEWLNLDVERSASLTPTRGGESIQGDRIAGNASWDLWVRNDSGTRGLNTGDRVVNARAPDQTFAIVFGPSDMDGSGAWLFLQLRSGAADD